MLNVVFEAAHLVHATGAEQLAERVDKPGATDPFGLHVADVAKADGAVVGDFDFFDGAVQCRHATGDGPAFEGGTGGTGCGENAMLVAEDQLSVRADIHDRDEAVFVSEVDGEHAGGCIGPDVATDDGGAVNASPGMNGQKALLASLDQASGCSLAFGHLGFGYRVVRGLADGIDALAEEEIAHGRVTDDDHLVD